MCFITYSLISFTRQAYTSAIAGIVSEGVFSKMDAGTINSIFNATYAISQIVGSYFVDKISPFKVITIGLVGAILSNLVMSLTASFWVFFAARAISGIAQFGIWPSFLKIVSDYICPSLRRRAMYIMPLGITLGTIISLLVASLVLNGGGWQSLLTISYASLLVMGAVFLVVVLYAKSKEVDREPTLPTADKAEDNGVSENTGSLRLILVSGGIFLLVASFCKSMIAAGISSWLPTLIMESYSVSPGFSSILSALVTLSNFFAIGWVILVYPRLIKNRVLAMGFFYVLALVPLAVLVFIGKIPLFVAVVLMVFVSMFKNAINQFFTVEIPVAYTRYNKAGMMAGMLNVFACLGSTVAGTLYGYTADNFGWNSTVLLWGGITLLGALCCAAAFPSWRRFVKKG